MDSAQKQLADRLKSANNILVTVSRDPSIDQLAACIGLSLLLNKMNKHAVAVFSGQPPSTIEFLKPAETLEKTTDSLRDFIIALDKDKADKLRYKVEDNVVRIFITPYKTSISEKDLDFSQGDFNVDVVVALGVAQQQDLDEAITAHGRILHDAAVACISLTNEGGDLGTINWKDPKASSLSQLVTDLAGQLGDNLLDNQIATALLTGIVAETERFSNDKTSPQAMNASSILMSAGADQQLVASKLEEPEKPPEQSGDEGSETDQSDEAADDAEEKSEPGELSIKHDKPASETNADSDADASESGQNQQGPAQQLPTPQPPEPPEPAGADEQAPAPLPSGQAGNLKPGAKLITDEAPSLGGVLNANTKPEGIDPVTDPMSMPQAEQDLLMNRKPLPPAPSDLAPPGPAPASAPSPAREPVSPQPEPAPVPAPVPAPAQVPQSNAQPSAPQPILAPEPPKPPQAQPQPASAPAAQPNNSGNQTLTEIEASVHSPHADPKTLETARDQVSQALQDSPEPAPKPIKALNAQPLGGKLHPDENQPALTPSGPDNPSPAPPAEPPKIESHNSSTLPFYNPPSESSITDPQPKPSDDRLSPSPQMSPQIHDPTSAPAVPPPFVPQAANKPANGPDDDENTASDPPIPL